MEELRTRYLAKVAILLSAFVFVAAIALCGCAQESLEENEADSGAVEQVENNAEGVEDATEEVSETEAATQSAPKSNTQAAPKSNSGSSNAPAASTPAPSPAPAHEHSWTPVTSTKTMYVCCDGASFASEAAASAHECQLGDANPTISHSNRHISQSTQSVTKGERCSGCGQTRWY